MPHASLRIHGKGAAGIAVLVQLPEHQLARSGQVELDVLVKFLETLSDQTISTSDSGTMSNQEQPSPRFVIICDVKNWKACAAARILYLLMAPRAAHVPRSLPHVLID